MSKLYILFLNNRIYGRGKWEYIQELMNDYVITKNMHGSEVVDFKIVESTDKTRQKLGQFIRKEDNNV